MAKTLNAGELLDLTSCLTSQQLFLSSEGNTAHGFAPLSPLTPLFSQGLILFIAHMLKQKPFQ